MNRQFHLLRLFREFLFYLVVPQFISSLLLARERLSPVVDHSGDPDVAKSKAISSPSL